MTRDEAQTAATYLVNIYGEPPQLTQLEERQTIFKGTESTEFQISVLYENHHASTEDEKGHLVTGEGESWEAALLNLLRSFNEDVPQQQEIQRRQ